MKRRDFLKIIGIAPVIVAVPALAKTDKPVAMGYDLGLDDRAVVTTGYYEPNDDGGGTFTLHGDGVTDDSKALQAFVDGKDVFYPDGTPFGKKPIF